MVPGITLSITRHSWRVPKIASVRLSAPSPRELSALKEATAKPDADKLMPASKPVPSNVLSTMSVEPPPKSQTIMKSPGWRLAHGLQELIRAVSSALSGWI